MQLLGLGLHHVAAELHGRLVIIDVLGQGIDIAGIVFEQVQIAICQMLDIGERQRRKAQNQLSERASETGIEGERRRRRLCD